MVKTKNRNKQVFRILIVKYRMNTKDIISKIQIKALYLGVAVLLVLSLISFMIGNHFFWKRVSEVRMLTGAGSRLKIYKTVLFP
jgi:hypothetical protein